MIFTLFWNSWIYLYIFLERKIKSCVSVQQQIKLTFYILINKFNKAVLAPSGIIAILVWYMSEYGSDV
jgi:phage-related protein